MASIGRATSTPTSPAVVLLALCALFRGAGGIIPDTHTVVGIRKWSTRAPAASKYAWRCWSQVYHSASTRDLLSFSTLDGTAPLPKITSSCRQRWIFHWVKRRHSA